MYPLFFYLCGLYHRGINHLSFSRGSLHAHYSIRLFLIEAKHRYKGKNINRKHTNKNIQSAKSIYTRLFNSPHQALAGSAPWLSTRGTSVLPQQTTKQLFFWLIQKGAFV